MADRALPEWVKPTLELGPIALFFGAYLMVKDETYTIAGTEYGGFIVVTAAFIPVLLLCTAILWRLTGQLSPMQIMTAVLVTVFGGLTVWLNDERFVKMKPSIIYAIFAAILAFGLWRGRSYLAMVMGDALPLDEAGFLALTRRMALFFGALALSNELVWRTMSTEVWVYFETFALPIATFAFIFGQILLLKIDDDDGEADTSEPAVESPPSSKG